MLRTAYLRSSILRHDKILLYFQVVSAVSVLREVTLCVVVISVLKLTVPFQAGGNTCAKCPVDVEA